MGNDEGKTTSKIIKTTTGRPGRPGRLVFPTAENGPLELVSAHWCFIAWAPGECTPMPAARPSDPDGLSAGILCGLLCWGWSRLTGWKTWRSAAVPSKIQEESGKWLCPKEGIALCRPLRAGHAAGQAAPIFTWSRTTSRGMESGYDLHLSIAFWNGSEWLSRIKSEDLCDLVDLGRIWIFYATAIHWAWPSGLFRSMKFQHGLQRINCTVSWANGAQKFYFIASFWAQPVGRWILKRLISSWCQSIAHVSLPRRGLKAALLKNSQPNNINL